VTAPDQSPLIAFMDGSDPVARNYLQLLCRWLLAERKGPDTDAERDAFLKNVLLENELPGDVPLKAREFKIPYTTPRIAFLIRIDQAEEIDCLEILQNLFPDRSTSFVLAMDEETIVALLDYPREDPGFIDRTAATILDTINAESLAKIRIALAWRLRR
jgi:carbohydrate diacid regulator